MAKKTKKYTVKELNAMKPSELLEVALEDLAWAQKNPKYKIDMDRWHAPQASGKCSVCLAGSILAAEGMLKPTEDYNCFEDFPDFAIRVNHLRTGDLYFGDADDNVREVFSYIINREFNRNTGRTTLRGYREGIEYLKSVGL